jgi:P27 family predicted phage terminase small subunit
MPKNSPPKHLSPATKRWWSAVVAAYELEAHHRTLLSLACEALDRCMAARAAIDRHGPIYTDRFGQPKARPEVAIERDSRIAFARMLRELQLDAGAPDPPRGPQLY